MPENILRIPLEIKLWRVLKPQENRWDPSPRPLKQGMQLKLCSACCDDSYAEDAFRLFQYSVNIHWLKWYTCNLDIQKHARVCTYICVCIYIYICVCVYIWMHTFIFVVVDFLRTYVCTYTIYIEVSTHRHTYVCIYIYIYRE